MQIKRIKCPKCGVVLDVTNSKNEAVKIITCPKCKVKLEVKFQRQPEQKPLEAHTVYGPQPPVNNGATQLGGSQGNGGATQLGLKGEGGSIQRALLSYNDKSYPLEIGQNIVGRKAQTSTATIQIATTDRYMSRQHAAILVKRMPDGSLKCTLRNDQNKNQTLVNGQPIENSDKITLIDGYRITMGKTTILFKCES